MRTLLQLLFGVEEMTPEKQLRRIKQLMGLQDTETDLLEAQIKCHNSQITIKELLKENKEFLLQALDKEKKELEGEAKKELELIKDLINRIENL